MYNNREKLNISLVFQRKNGNYLYLTNTFSNQLGHAYHD